jgi:hypothetical protein
MGHQDENWDPEGRLVLDHLRLLDRQLVANTDRKTGKLIRLRLAMAEAKRLALQREEDQQRSLFIQ